MPDKNTPAPDDKKSWTIKFKGLQPKKHSIAEQQAAKEYEAVIRDMLIKVDPKLAIAWDFQCAVKGMTSGEVLAVSLASWLIAQDEN